MEHDAPAREVGLERSATFGQQERRRTGRAGLAHLADRLVEEHVLRRTAAAGSVVCCAAPVDEQRAAASEGGVVTAVERNRRALADDQAVGRERREHAPGHALDAHDRQHDRACIECGRDVELGPPHVLPGRRRELQLRIVGRGFLVDFLEPDLRDAAEEPGCHGPPVRLDHRRARGRGEIAADRGDAPVLYQDVGILERAGAACRVHARAADQDILRAGDPGREEEGGRDERQFPHSWKSERGFDAGCARSYRSTPSTNTRSASA